MIGLEKLIYMCNNCKGHIETRYHCTVCDDFDLCIQCYEKDGHRHKIEKLGLHLDDGSSPSENKASPEKEAKKLSIQCCIQCLGHTSQGRDANCMPPSSPSFQKMERVLKQQKVCKRKINGDCPICNPICKQLIALCCYHNKHCQETKCSVPFCPNFEDKLKQQQLQQRLQQAQLLRRRIAVMNTTRTMQPASAVPGGNIPALTREPQSVIPGAVSPASSMNTSTISSTGMGMPSPHQPGIGIKPQTPPANMLQVVKQVQEEAAPQQQPHVGYGKLNPSAGVPGHAMPPPQVRAMGHLGAGQGGNLLPMEQWQQMYPRGSGQGLRQPGPLLMQQQQAQLGAGLMQGGTPTVRPGATALNNPGNTMMQHKQALPQLMQTLQSPQSPDQRLQILQIFKSNPPLMAAFIKQRQLVIKQVQKEAARQQQPHVGYDKVNPSAGVRSQAMLPPQVQQAMGHLGAGQGNLAFENALSHYIQNAAAIVMEQQGPQLMQQQAQLGAGPMDH